MFEYCSLKIFVRNVQNGVRAFILMSLMTTSEDAFPVSSGYEKGNWKLTKYFNI